MQVTVPPERYDHPYNGQVIERRLTTSALVPRAVMSRA